MHNSGISLSGEIEKLNFDKTLESIPKRPKHNLEEIEESEKQKVIRRNLARLYKPAKGLRDKYLKTYQVTQGQQQQSAKDRVVRICENIRRFVGEGNQLILWGNIGTGKDHLAFAALRHAVSEGYSAVWREGLSIYEEVADAYREDKTHKEIYRTYAFPDILCISDPVFVCNWTQAKQEALRKIVRLRYDAGKTTWITVNVKSVDQIGEMAGFDTLDRIFHKAAVIPCQWESYRKGERSEF